MNDFRKISGLCALILALCLTLSACGSGPKQAAADSSEEATVNFLTNLQNGEFDMAKTYLAEDNPLLNVFPVAEGETAPELDGVYSQFREKMRGFTFHVADGEAAGNSMVYIAATQYDFRAAVNAAMLAALQDQCQNGGSAFADYAGWMGQGIANAEMGQENTVRAMASKTNGTYTIDHRSYTDHDFMNLITGGFYDYADFQMAVCTSSADGVDHTYYLAALGDEVIACIEEFAEEDTSGQFTDDVIAEFNAAYRQSTEQMSGIWMGVHKAGDKVSICIGIDFQTADQNALVSSGMVSGEYQGNMVDGWLSLSATISGFESDGMTCTVTPVYEAAE